MNRKMQGFLLSLGLSDVERFDMDFTLVAKDEYTPNKVNMMVEKESLWTYELLDEFIMGLGKVNYNYTIRFFYPNCTLTSQDVFELLDSWYPRNYFMPVRFQADCSDPNRLVIVYSDEKERDFNIPRIKEFKDLLKLINYTMVIDHTVDAFRAKRIAEEAISASRRVVIEEEDISEVEEKPVSELAPIAEPLSNDVADNSTLPLMIEASETVEEKFLGTADEGVDNGSPERQEEADSTLLLDNQESINEADSVPQEATPEDLSVNEENDLSDETTLSYSEGPADEGNETAFFSADYALEEETNVDDPESSVQARTQEYEEIMESSDDLSSSSNEEEEKQIDVVDDDMSTSNGEEGSYPDPTDDIVIEAVEEEPDEDAIVDIPITENEETGDDSLPESDLSLEEGQREFDEERVNDEETDASCDDGIEQEEKQSEDSFASENENEEEKTVQFGHERNDFDEEDEDDEDDEVSMGVSEDDDLSPLEEYDVPEEDDEEYQNMSGSDSIVYDSRRFQEESEAFLLEQKEKNLAEWEEAKRRKALYRKGDYELVESIDEIYGLTGNHNLDFEGSIFAVDPRLTKNGKQMNRISLADDTNAISVVVFTSAQLDNDAVASLAIGQRVRIRGALDIDTYTKLPSIRCHYLNQLPKKGLRTDPEPVKRVELHLHTKMSTMDGVSEMKDYVAVAKSMGMTAIAVTDHGSLQSLPAAQEECGKAGIKPIYGVEAYMVDPKQKIISNPANIPLKNAKFCVFDTETTGLVPRFDRIVEFGGVIVQNGNVLESWNVYINPRIPMTPGSSAINHITDDMLVDKPFEEDVLPKILRMFEGCILVAHNASFDMGFINAALERNGYPPLTNPVIDTLPISHYLFPEKASHKEESLLKNLGLNVYSREDAHEAIYDATRLNEGWQVILPILEEKKPGITHADLDSLTIEMPPEELKQTDPDEYSRRCKIFSSYIGHLREKHTTILVKNAQGLKDINRVISLGETTFLSGNPLLPRSPRDLLEKYHDNLLFGSACQNGEIFDLAQSESPEELAKAMAFYDFIEIQPLDCYSNLLNMGEIRNEGALKDILNNIIEAARIANKPVVATGDCHYANPEDKIVRDVYITAKSIGNRNHPLWRARRDSMPWFDNPNQHFRSTDEMIRDFSSWLGEEYAREIVVTNSNLIADQITTEPVPISEKTFTPNQNIPNSEVVLRELCESNFQKRYGGNEDPEVKARIEEVHQRLLTELEGIIGNGYAVTYIIAHHLIRMAAEEPEHYIVGSRGSVGSSFAATMADITEVNPLAPHYLCPHCHYFEWGDSKKYKSGFDLPDKVCPQCGEKLVQNGQNIPFQTFLGFSAEKVPDIDLNFEDESQKKAHNYTKILLGADKVFRAGTIETVAEKTAFGFVKKFFRIRDGEAGENVNPQWVNYLASRVEGVKRTTGQHPGGIVVVPKEHDVTDFTAYQHPADDRNSEWLTTHYDYHAMHDELLKLDILGHVDPMAMRYYRDITGVPIESIPMNDPRVISLFTSPKELRLHENFLQLKTGVSAIPEFGTRLAQQMLDVAQPKCFNDLLIISGLAHGTDVWSGNAEDLIKSGTTDINGVIGCRDDIMTYLISMGIENAKAFKIMEGIRKGKYRKNEADWTPILEAHHVPDWYIESCRKIKYLFPRGHATAYVMMAVRVAWFKLYRPLEFYSVFFSIRSDDWDIKTMIEGEEAIKTRYMELNARRQSRDNPLSNKETNILKTLQIAIEMVERGFHFAKMDLYKSDGKMFLPDHANNCLIPPFSVIDGLGVAAGNSVVEARSNGKPFLSKEDLLSRTKLSRTNVDALIEIGGIEPLSERNQMSLFDFFDE